MVLLLVIKMTHRSSPTHTAVLFYAITDDAADGNLSRTAGGHFEMGVISRIPQHELDESYVSDAFSDDGDAGVYDTGIALSADRGHTLLITASPNLGKLGYIFAEGSLVISKAQNSESVRIVLVKTSSDVPDLELPCLDILHVTVVGTGTFRGKANLVESPSIPYMQDNPTVARRSAQTNYDRQAPVMSMSQARRNRRGGRR